MSAGATTEGKPAVREAASVILLREAAPAPGGRQGFEVLMLRRRKGAAWASAFVFPGGATDPGEDARTAAARELFEEAGVLLATITHDEHDTLGIADLSTLRAEVLAGADAGSVLARAGMAWATESLVPWSHWITPSAEPKRFSARFFVCELPPGQMSSHDDIETVEQLWIRPADAIARAGALVLPPPQVRTCWELARYATIAEVLAAGARRAEESHPIMPRLRVAGANPAPTLLLPWDPEYRDLGTGESAPMTYTPAWAIGPSRFVRENDTWKHVAAPGSTIAG